MGVSKVIYGDQTLIDLTNDTVAANKLLNGYTAHGADGSVVNGAVKVGSKTVTAGTSDINVTPDAGYDLMDTVTVHPTPSQAKIATPSSSGIVTVTPDPGYLLGSVGVEPYDLQNKTVAAGTSNVTVTPDNGYDGLGRVIVQPTPTQTKTVAPTTSDTTVTPDSGYHLSQVTVGRISPEYIIPSGNVDVTRTKNGTISDIDIREYATLSINTNVSLQEYTLWINSSPESDFAAKNITLPQSIAVYPFIKIDWQFSTKTAETSFYSQIFETAELMTYKRYSIGGAPDTSTTARYRYFRFSSGTTVGWSNSVQHTSSSQTTSAKFVIPRFISGMRYY